MLNSVKRTLKGFPKKPYSYKRKASRVWGYTLKAIFKHVKERGWKASCLRVQKYNIRHPPTQFQGTLTSVIVRYRQLSSDKSCLLDHFSISSLSFPRARACAQRVRLLLPSLLTFSLQQQQQPFFLYFLCYFLSCLSLSYFEASHPKLDVKEFVEFMVKATRESHLNFAQRSAVSHNVPLSPDGSEANSRILIPKMPTA